MHITNTTRSTVISDNVRDLKRLDEMLVGLIGRAEPQAVYFKTRWGIHTLGVRFPIDVVILDDTNTIRALRKDLEPFRFFFWDPEWENVLELPAGTITATRTEIGDTLRIE